MRAVIYSLRGAAGFGIAAFLVAFAETYIPSPQVVRLLFFPFAAGVVGALLLTWPTETHARGLLGFGIGFVVLWLTCSFAPTLFRDFGGRTWYAWALGFAAAGTIGGQLSRDELCFPGLAAFAVGGVVGGMSYSALTRRQLNPQDMIVAMTLGGTVSGALFGAAVGWVKRNV